ncbi:hypothetical protein BJX99DRAFT_240360 [Aspergillus californicus]
MMASRPSLRRSVTVPNRPISIVVPARLANESRLPSKPCGFLAEKGRFPYRERALSCDSTQLREADLGPGLDLEEEVEVLKGKVAEQKGVIEGLQRKISEIVVGERGGYTGQT